MQNGSIFTRLTTPIYESNVMNLPPPLVFEEAAPVVQPITDDAFWRIIDSFQWTDRSDRLVSLDRARRIFHNLSNEERGQFTCRFNECANNIKLFVLPRLIIAHDVDLRALASHIVARGKLFYDGITEDPSFAEYIIAMKDYQNFYDVIE